MARQRGGCARPGARRAIGGRSLPAVRLRAFRPADAPIVRRWAIAPEPFLRVQDLLARARAPGTLTSVAVDADGRTVAIFQAAPEGDVEAGMRSIALLVHPGRRGAGFGRATLLAALDEPCSEDSVLLAVVDRGNAASLRCFGACGFMADDDAASDGLVRMVRPRQAGGAPGACGDLRPDSAELRRCPEVARVRRSNPGEPARRIAVRR